MRVKSDIYTEMRGRLGGQTIRNNLFGKVLAPVTASTQPNTPKQIENRESFKNASLAWAAVDPAEQIEWKNYASSMYEPAQPKPDTVYSGRMAFQSLNTIKNNLVKTFANMDAPQTVTVKWNTTNMTGSIITPNSNIPSDKLNALLTDKSGTEATIIASNIAIDSTALTATVTMQLNKAFELDANDVINYDGLTRIFAVFLSTEIPTMSTTPTRTLSRMLACTGKITANTGIALTASQEISFVIPITEDQYSVKKGIAKNQMFVASFVIMDEHGQQKILFQKKIAVN